MKVTQDSAVFEKAHDALVQEHRIHMNPDALQTVVETVLDGRVTHLHAERRYRQGIEAAADVHERLVKCVATLDRTRAFIAESLAWTGPEDRQDATLAELDRLLADLKSVTTDTSTP